MLNRKQFSEDIFMFRTNKGLSRASAAEQIGIHPSNMQTLEEGIYEPKATTHYLVCKWLGKDLDHYFKNYKL